MRSHRSLVVVAALAAVFFTWSNLRSSPPPGEGLDQAIDGIRPKAIRAHMTFLADDLLEGRGTGTRGYDLATNYVAAQFMALGLEAAGVDGTFFQPVPMMKTLVDEERSSLKLRQTGQDKRLTFGEDHVLMGDFLRLETDVDAPIVFAGFGVTAPEQGYDDYSEIDTKGKVVAQFVGAPSQFPSNQRAYYSSWETKRENAFAHGAVGIIALWTPEMDQQFPWSAMVRFSQLGSMSWLDQKGVPHGQKGEIRGTGILSRVAAQALFSDAPQSYEQALEATKAGKSRGFDIPAEVHLQITSRHERLESPNVIAMLRGSDPELREEYVVYTAHLDHEGIGEPRNGDAIYNGAFDNASGVAALLEAARAFASLDTPPRRSVLFIATACEEGGLLGADYFTHVPTVPWLNVVANVNIDGIGVLFPSKDVIAYGYEHSSLGAVAARAASRLDYELSPDPFAEQNFFIRADQYPFVEAGVPAIWYMFGLTSADPQVDGAAFTQKWLTTVYHSPKDDMDQRFDFEAGAKFAKLEFLVGYLIADQLERPTWNPGDFFGEKFGSLP